MSKTKIIILIPCWKRAEILKIVSAQLEIFMKYNKLKYNLCVLFVFSKEDPELDALNEIYNNAGYTKEMIYSPNPKLGRKHNAGIKKALDMGCDYVMNMGSDDLIHHTLLDLYKPCIDTKQIIFGIDKLYFYDISTEKALFFEYYNKPFVVGAGRMIHRTALENVIYRTGKLYDPELKRGLDTNSANKLKLCGFEQRVVCPGSFPMLVDIKSEININGFDRIENNGNSNLIKKADSWMLKAYFPILMNN